MSTYQATATERVKTFAPRGLNFLNLGDLRAFMEAKGFDLQVAEHFAREDRFGRLFSELVLRSDKILTDKLDQYVQALRVITPSQTQPYKGSDLQNSRIDVAIANSGISSGITRYGEGTASFFSAFTSVPPEIRYTPIAVIGYGAAGIMATYALRQLNFRKVTVFEQAKPLGIWSHDNVFRLSRNNPLRLQFFDEVLEPAPGGGTEVREFLEELVGETPRNAKVIGVKPGNLKHRVYLAGGEEAEFPIVINAMGLGKPKPVSDPDRMITQTGQRNAGIRWQHRLDPEKVRGKRIILIGLGNSTAEMLQQIHDLIDSGVPIDYQVLTHYPQKSVENPTTDVRQGKRVFHVFRDLSKPNLVDYQGDLPRSRYDYFRALHEGRIISGVTRWEVPSRGMMVIYDKNGDPMGTLPFDQLMTLIGYHRSEELMRSFGCTWDPMTECGVFDYDGEVAARPGSIDATKRLHKGCFGFGSILETPHNPNAIVIPGMLHRVGDLMFAIIMRAGEYNKRALRV